jgi:hypothetical protein
VEVTSNDYLYSGGNYALTATFSAGSSGLELEPNDDSANAIASGSQIRGQLSNADDVDWFYLKTSAAGDLQVAFDAPTSSTFSNYFQVWAFDEDGNLLGSKATGQDTNFTVGAPAADNFFIAVTTAQSYLHDSGQYGLTVTSTASTVNRESETNDTSATADSLALGSSIVGQLATAADVDRFTVGLSSAGTLTVNFDGPTNSTWTDYFRVEVYGPTGTLLATRNTGVDTAFDVKAPSSGNYTVAIATASSWSHSPGEYRLGVTAVLEDPPPAGAITGTPLGDRLTGTGQDDLIYGLGGNDLINGGAGTDTAVFRAATSNLSINTIGGLTAVRGNYAAGEHALTVSRLWNIEKIKTWTDEMPLSAATVTPLLGTPQADRLNGTTGNDLIDGLGGSDFIDGGAGTDTLALFGARGKFVVTTVAGITRIEGGEGTEEYAGHITRTVGVESLGFTPNETRALTVNDTAKIFGSVGGDRLTGTASDEIFDGLGGADQVDGSAGSDTLVFFGRYQDFTVTLPTASKPELTILGKATAGKDYAGQTVRATNIEKIAFTDVQIDVNNPPGLVMAPASTLVTEGGAGVAIALSLSVQPTSTVTVAVSGGNQLAASAAQISFNATNWNTPQTVTISAVDDTAVEKQHTASLSLTVSSTDPQYASVSAKTVSYTISDNDVASVGSVKGLFWNDADKDGVVDAGEQPLAGWTVFDDVNRNGRLDSGEASVKTDSSGRYQLDDLSTGQHTIVARAETGWSPTFPSLSNSSAAIIVSAPGSGEGTTGEIRSTELSATAAGTAYANLGTATNVAAFHADPRFSSIKGQGVSVVVIDTGFDLDHPAFGPDSDRDGVADRIVYHYDFFQQGDRDVSTPNPHGTHVAAIVGSSDSTYPGVAPGVNLIVLKVFEDREKPIASQSDLLDAINWVVANATKYNVVAVNLSVGNSAFDQVPTLGYASTQFKALANAGVVVVSAAGNWYADNPNTTAVNETGWRGVQYPSSDPYSLSVGAVWAASTGTWGPQVGKTDVIAAFSQRDDSEIDIFAPGVAITAARNGGGYVALDGTSMASPEIAGMVALVQQLSLRELGRRLSFEEIRSLLKATGDSIVDGDDENDGSIPNTGLTFYRADMLALAEAILALKPPVSHTVTIASGTVVDGKNFGFSTGAAVQGLAADDFIVGAGNGEIIRGGAGADQIDAGDGDDQVYGELGDDRLTGGPGNDTIDGGEGRDAAVFTGKRAEYTLTVDATARRVIVTDSVANRDGVDTLDAVEQLVFSDLSMGALTVNSAPAGSVTITGTASQGQTLTASNTLTDADGLPTSGPSVLTYQWKANGTAINGATGGTYTLSQAEVGKTITVTASYTDNGGTSESLTSMATAAVSNVNDTPIGSVTITGTPTQGQTLTAANTLADADGIPTSGSGAIAYQWRADGVAISGATGSTLVLTQAQVGKTVTAAARYTDNFGTLESVTSSATTAVANVNDAPTGTITITGTPTQGQTLTAANTLADVDGIPTAGSGAIAYQWSAGGVAISGTTGNTLVLTQAQVGKTITLAARYTDNFGTLESVTSSATTAVANVNDAPTGSVTISGTATRGQTLTAANTLADVDGIPTSGSGAIAYQWRADGAPISGATSSSFLLTQAQVGKAVSVTASYTDSGGTTESVTSSATAAVTNVNIAPTGTVTITGTPTQGQTLTAANALTDPDGIPTSGAGAIAYQWSAGGVAISGATGSTLNLTQSLVGKALTVRASYTDNFGQAESVISAATSVVANVNDAPTGAVSISGNASQRHSLLATNTLADVDGIPGSGAGAISYQWRANGAPISGATGSTFSPTPTQIGKVITVTASYTDLGGAVESITSPATEPIRGFREFWHDAVTRGMERPNPQALPFGQDLLMADTSYASDLARLFGVPLEFGS